MGWVAAGVDGELRGRRKTWIKMKNVRGLGLHLRKIMGAAAEGAPDAEMARCHRLLLRLQKERRLPSWVSLDTGEIVVDGQAFPYVKEWALDASTADIPAGEVVKALARWAVRK